MAVGEVLVMRAIAGAVGVEQHHHQTRLFGIPAHAAACLDVFGGGLGLAEHQHQAKSGDVEAH